MNTTTLAPAPDPSSAAAPLAACAPWTCPFCSLLCDGFGLQDGDPPQLLGSDCPRATKALAAFARPASPVTPSIDGAPATLEAALDAAAARLAGARQPLFGGLATDVAGMRQLYRLANACGAILDHAHGDALMHALRPLQDRGQMFTTLSEIHTRADLVVCFGTDATNYPEFFRRCAPAADSGLQRRTVFVSTVPPAQAIEGSSVETVTGQGDLFDTAATLAALVEQRRVSQPAPELAELAEALSGARYAVLVWEPAQLPAHGALIGETLLRLVMSLNRSTRAGMFALGGLDGAQTANAAMTWLSGLPLRSRVGPRGLEHQPLQYATDRLLAGDEVDLLLWVASFGPNLPPPATGVPRIVLGHPTQAPHCAEKGTIFIPVATPGVNASGHLLRADSVVALPLHAIRDDGLPGVADVARALDARLALVAEDAR